MSISEILLTPVVGETLSLYGMIISLIASLVLGVFISLIYLFTHRKEGYSPSFTITLIMLPAIIDIVIMLIGNSVARAFSLAGAFSLIRFRSAPGDAKDIAYVFFTLGVGLACGMGYIAYAAIFAFTLCTVMVILYFIKYAEPKSPVMELKITVPEDLNFEGAFEDILSKYTSHYKLRRIKTKNFGTLFEVAYYIKLKHNTQKKEFIDQLRCKNGNLNISLIQRAYDEKSLK